MVRASVQVTVLQPANKDRNHSRCCQRLRGTKGIWRSFASCRSPSNFWRPLFSRPPQRWNPTCQQNVVPMFGPQNPFSLEAVMAIQKCHEFNMGDKKPRLIVGSVIYSEDEITLLAERIFSHRKDRQEEAPGSLVDRHTVENSYEAHVMSAVLADPRHPSTKAANGKMPWTNVSGVFPPCG